MVSYLPSTSQNGSEVYLNEIYFDRQQITDLVSSEYMSWDKASQIYNAFSAHLTRIYNSIPTVIPMTRIRAYLYRKYAHLT